MKDQAPTMVALAQFLARQVQPAITDPALGFRVRVAGWLLGGLAREAQWGEAHAEAQAQRLAALLDVGAPPDGARSEAWLLAAERELARLLRTDALDAVALAGVRAHLLQTLGETLDVVQPGFDRRMDIEGAKGG